MLERAENSYRPEPAVRSTILPRELRIPRSVALGSAGLGVVGLLLFGSPAQAASCLYEDRRTVLNPQRTPVAGATVSIRGVDGKEIKSGTTGSDGKVTTRVISECVPLPDGRQGLKVIVRVHKDDKVVQDPREPFAVADRDWREWLTIINVSVTPTTRLPDRSPTPTARVEPTRTPTPFPAGTPASVEEARTRVAAGRTAQVPTPTPTKAPDFMGTAQAEARMTPSAPTPPAGENFFLNIWNQIAKFASDHPILTGVGLVTAVGLAIRPTRRHVYNFYRFPDRGLRTLIAIPLHKAGMPLWP